VQFGKGAKVTGISRSHEEKRRVLLIFDLA
jgi:hypothetical protein